MPFSLIEVAFRNAADRVISDAHASGDDWLLASGRDGDELVALDVAAPTGLIGERYDGTPDDPIAQAARMARTQLGRDRISRDDLIAHLMFGFWVNRCPDALAKDPGLRVWDLLAAHYDDPALNNSEDLALTMTRLLRLRNRVAHHEPVLFRAKHVFTRAGDPKAPIDIVLSLQSALTNFEEEVELTVSTAKAMAPMAARHVADVPTHVKAEIGPLGATLVKELARLRELRESRKAARKAERAAKAAAEQPDNPTE